MDNATISSLITSVGFPIAMCVALFWYMIKQNELHAEETKNITNVINELKLAITELRDELRSFKDDNKN